MQKCGAQVAWFVQEDDAEHGGSGGADTGPDGVSGAHGNGLQRKAMKETDGAMQQTVPTLGHRRVKPLVYFKPRPAVQGRSGEEEVEPGL